MSFASEIAEASIALANDLPVAYVKPTYSNALIDTAKRLQRLQSKAKRLRRELKTIAQDIKTTKRELKALAAELKRGA